MLRKVRDLDNAIKREASRRPSDILETEDFVFMGEEGMVFVKSLGKGRVNLEVYYPIDSFSWLDRDSVRRRLESFLREWLSEYSIYDVYIYNS